MANNKIKDFGEKIGGAKKDLWKKRNFSTDDLDNLTEREAFKYCIKDNIWKKPNYEELCKEKPVIVVYFIKILRDSLPAKVKPSNNEEINKENRKLFIEFISECRDVIMNINKEKELEKIFDEIFIKNGYYDKGWTKKCYKNDSIQNKFIRKARIKKYEIFKAKEEIKKTGFPKKIPVWKKNLKIKERGNKFFIVKSKSYYYEKVCDINFNSYEEAKKYLENELEEKLKNNRKKRTTLSKPKLKSIVRIGPNYRNVNVSTNMMLETFNFRGGEFGNWASDIERQMHLNYAYDALIDLARILNVKTSFVSFDKRLGIAFGARGSGNALAHYEPAKVVINLTKIKGAGNLAHEWFHAFDDYLGHLCGNNISNPFASENISRSNIINKNKSISDNVILNYKKIIDTIKNKECSNEEKKKSIKNKINSYKNMLELILNPIQKYLKEEQKGYKKTRRAATCEEINKYNEIVNIMINGQIHYTSDIEKIIEELNNLHKKIKGIMINKENRKLLYNYLFFLDSFNQKLKNINNIKKTKNTDFYKSAKKLDEGKSKLYWSTNVEMIARAFEAYIQDKIQEQGHQSDYLVHHADNKAFGDLNPYPKDIERKKINKSFDDFFKVFKDYMKLEEFKIKICSEQHFSNSETSPIKEQLSFL